MASLMASSVPYLAPVRWTSPVSVDSFQPLFPSLGLLPLAAEEDVYPSVVISAVSIANCLILESFENREFVNYHSERAILSLS
jgi:hypothetical protein